MLKKLWRKAKKAVKKTVVVATAALALSSPSKAEKPTPVNHNTTSTYVVQEGDYVSKIAEQRLSYKESPSVEEIIQETNRISKLNGKGTVQEYEWSPGYDCSQADERDPNCIYPGEELVLEKATVNESSEEQVYESDEESFDYTLPLSWLFTLTGAGLVIAGNLRAKKKQTLDKIVEEKNKNPYTSIDKICSEKNYEGDFRKDYFSLYSKGSIDARIERYDSSLAPREMKEEMLDMYQGSEESLEQVSEYLSDKYGMNVSSSTISRYGRKELGVDSRKEAREENESPGRRDPEAGTES